MLDQVKRNLLQGIMNRWFLVLRRVKTTQEPSSGESDPATLLHQMTFAEKLAYISGVESFAITGIPRLRIPPIWLSDATSGVRGVDAPVTAFPSPIAMSASWDREGISTLGRMIGQECRASGISFLLAPGINIARVPVCGRNFEYMGEDPYLTGEMASAYVHGVQSSGVGVTVKHFACNNSEYDRHKSNSVVDERTLRELYLSAFETVIRRGSVGVMTSYNQVNGTYASEHPFLIGKILRLEWGFDGLLVSDWNSLYSTEGAFKHGVDLEMPKARWFTPDSLGHMIRKDPGLIKFLDTKVYSILCAAKRVGALDRPVTDPSASTGTASHRTHARSIATESVVLLKNEGVLPLSVDQALKIVILGNAGPSEPIGGGGSSFIKQARAGAPIARCLQKRAGDAEVCTLHGHWWRSRRNQSLVTSADVVLVSTGFNHVYESESYDRRWSLPDRELQTIDMASSLNPRVVVMVHAGGAFEMDSWIDKVSSVMLCWYLGQTSADALVDLLMGVCNPSGRLPISIARRLDQYETMYSYPQDFDRFSLSRIAVGQGNPRRRRVTDLPYREGLMVGYRQFDTIGPEPLFPFGFGLSYTSFAYGDLIIEKDGDQWHLSCSVTNTGGREGAEVVQLYVRLPDPGKERPKQQLRGFERAFLQPGESLVVRFCLGLRDFSEYSVADARWRVVPGQSIIAIGSSSRDIRLEERVWIQKSPDQGKP